MREAGFELATAELRELEMAGRRMALYQQQEAWMGHEGTQRMGLETGHLSS